MISDELRKIAKERTPAVRMELVRGAYRHNVIERLIGHQNLGVELGVASGVFSERMVRSGKFSMFIGVDVYQDRPQEYGQALTRVGLLEPYKLLRMTFDEAVRLFEDNSLDFVYVDGYAHTGEEGGKTLAAWYPKLKKGGILAGDDYSDDWPLVKWAVNSFVERLGTCLYVTELVESETYCMYPSWFIVKEQDIMELENFLPADLLAIGASEQRRVQRKRQLKRLKRSFLSTLDATARFAIGFVRKPK